MSDTTVVLDTIALWVAPVSLGPVISSGVSTRAGILPPEQVLVRDRDVYREFSSRDFLPTRVAGESDNQEAVVLALEFDSCDAHIALADAVDRDSSHSVRTILSSGKTAPAAYNLLMSSEGDGTVLSVLLEHSGVLPNDIGSALLYAIELGNEQTALVLASDDRLTLEGLSESILSSVSRGLHNITPLLVHRVNEDNGEYVSRNVVPHLEKMRTKHSREALAGIRDRLALIDADKIERA